MEVLIEIVFGNAIAEYGVLKSEKNKVIILGPRLIQIMANEPEVFVFGREGTNKNVHIKLVGDPTISKHHFKLEVLPPKVFFKECEGVSNPSRINNLLRVEDELKSGDIIEVGYTKLKVNIKNGS